MSDPDDSESDRPKSVRCREWVLPVGQSEVQYVGVLRREKLRRGGLGR